MLEGRKEFHPRELNDIREILGAAGHEIVNAADGDATPAYEKSRYAEVDTDGIIKFDYKNLISGETLTFVGNVFSGTPIHYPNICKVYRYYKGTTACTATVFLTNGTAEVAGLRLVK